MEKIFLSFEKEKFNGNILDITSSKEGVIYSLYKQQDDDEDVDYIDSNLRNNSLYEDYYDSCVMFFSLNSIITSKRKKRLLLDISRAMKKNGYIYIWDIDKKPFSIISKDVRIGLPDKSFKDIKINSYNLFTNNTKNKIIDMLTSYFTIIEARSCNEVYSIICKRKEVNI